MDIENLMKGIRNCSEASKFIWDRLFKSVPEISVLMESVQSPDGVYSFRIPLGDGRLTLSVNVPPDAMGNRGIDMDGSSVPKCIETALIGTDGHLVYIDGLGYDDIRRFGGDSTYVDAISDLEAEILRLLPYAKGDVEIPEE